MTANSLARPRVLLVEDDRMVLETVTLMLEDDYDVLASTSVSTALAQLDCANARSIDVMLLDCRLPDGNVTDLLTITDQRSIPVVLTSGDPAQTRKWSTTRLVLPKPFNQSSLLQILGSARD